MTMAVVVKNADPHRVLEVEEQHLSTRDHHVQKSVLQGGEARTYYIHAAKYLVVREDPEASIPAVKGGPA